LFTHSLAHSGRVIQQRRDRITGSLNRRNSTATDIKFPMYLIPLDQLDRLYGGKEPRHGRIEAHQELKRRGELVRWEDLPIDAHIIFLSHEWVGWNHPDPHGIQLKTFLRVIERLRSGDISYIEMNWFHRLMYEFCFFSLFTHIHTRAHSQIHTRTYAHRYNKNIRTPKQEWKEVLSTAYVWMDWASMPQPSACSPNVEKKKKDLLGTQLGDAVKSIPAYVHIYTHTHFITTNIFKMYSTGT